MKQIYIHGLGQTPDDWKEVLHRLNSEKDGVCPDLPAMVSAGQATYTDLYRAFARFCSRIEGPLSLCGLSLGGVLALHYAAEHPEQVDRLVLIAPQYRMPKRLLQVQNLLFRCMPRSLFRQMGFSKDQFIQLCKSMEELDFSGSLSRISCPVLVLCGSRDRANKRACRELSQRLDRAELCIVEGAGHELNREVPAELARLLDSFYAR